MVAESPDDLIGSVLGERYRLLGFLGRGGMGSVYRAEHVLMKKEVAVKILHPEMGQVPEVARRFEREAQSASCLDHEHIILVTDFGCAPSPIGELLFLVMEILRGESLKQVIERRGRLAPAAAVTIVRQILAALEHAHGQGVVHRDLKPDNIMLLERGGRSDFVKILDFGIAKVTQPDGRSDELTKAGAIFGTPEYISPEQAMGQPADGRADLYAIGVMLYEMLTGRRPFVSDNMLEVLSMHLTRRPQPPRTVAPEAAIAPPLERVVMRALEKKREARFQSATEMATTLAGLGTLSGGDAQEEPRLSEAARRLQVRAGVKWFRVRQAIDRAGSRWPWLGRGLATIDAVRQRAVSWFRALPDGVRRMLLVGGPALVLFLVLGIWGVGALTGPSHPAAAPPPAPRPVQPDVREALAQADKMLGQGKLKKARALLQVQLTEHPKSARVRLQFGHLLFAEKQFAEALAQYRDAIRLDPGFRGDEALLANVRSQLDERAHREQALALLCDDVGQPALDDLLEVASSGSTKELRHRAAVAVVRLGAKDRLDQYRLRMLDLKQARRCEDKRAAILALQELEDPRALPLLKKMYRARQGLLRRSYVHGCVRKELRAAIKSLSKKRGRR